MADQITVTFTELTTQKHADVKLSTNLTGKELIEKLKKGNFLHDLRPGESYILHHRRSGTEIGPNISLAQVGVQPNDVITVGVNTKGG
jgi:hypothetical protein